MCSGPTKSVHGRTVTLCVYFVVEGVVLPFVCRWADETFCQISYMPAESDSVCTYKYGVGMFVIPNSNLPAMCVYTYHLHVYIRGASAAWLKES